MRCKKPLAVCLAAAMGLLVFTGCSNEKTARLTNEITFSLEGISEITISYDEENITFYESEGNELILKEYMTKGRNRYYAKVKQSGDRIKISEGRKPFFKGGFYRYVEVYLPASYGKELTISTTDGNIDFSEFEISLNALRIDSTAGRIRLNNVEAQTLCLSTTRGSIDAVWLKAESIRIDMTSGNFSCEKLDGNVAYTTTSGNADIASAVGAGDYKASNSGKLNVTYTKVTGDLSFYNKNDTIQLALPVDLAFRFEATTKNGAVSTSFQECVSVEGRTTSGIVGGHPTVTVTAETHNGDIRVKRQP